MTSAETRQHALLRVMSGEPIERISKELGVTVSQIERWLNESDANTSSNESILSEIRKPVEVPREAILALLEEGDLVTVEHEGARDVAVTFPDLVAHGFPKLVGECLSTIRQFPNVDTVQQEDRELLIGYGEDIDVEQLEETLRELIERRLREDLSLSS